MLTKEKIQKYGDKLEAEKRKLAQEIETDKKQLDFGNDVDSFDEETDEAEEIGNEQAVRNVLTQRIARIDAALGRIERRVFGRCEKCGAEISEKILDAAPESNLCEKCKKNK